jgi:hypothetical protein
MDLRTFLPVPPVAVGELPRVGDPAPACGPATPGRPAVIAFLRHVGCPFAEATLLALAQQPDRHPRVSFLAVSHAPEPTTVDWRARIGADPARVELISDPSRALYAAWGLGRTTAAHFLGHRSLGAVVRLARKGIRNRHPVGTRWQTAGTFAVDSGGVVRWRHVPTHAGELPDLDAAALAAGGG